MHCKLVQCRTATAGCNNQPGTFMLQTLKGAVAYHMWSYGTERAADNHCLQDACCHQLLELRGDMYTMRHAFGCSKGPVAQTRPARPTAEHQVWLWLIAQLHSPNPCATLTQTSTPVCSGAGTPGWTAQLLLQGARLNSPMVGQLLPRKQAAAAAPNCDSKAKHPVRILMNQTRRLAQVNSQTIGV